MYFIIYDLEATCWQGKPANKTQEIIEVGAIKMDRFGEITDEFSRFVRPVLNPVLSAYCKELTSIDQIAINRADKFDQVIEDFQDWIEIFDEEYLLCSWGRFDKPLLKQDCELHQIETDWLDPHINVKRQYQEMKRLRKPRGLMNAIEAEGFEFTGMHHRALSDAQNLGKIFSKYLDEWVY